MAAKRKRKDPAGLTPGQWWTAVGLGVLLASHEPPAPVASAGPTLASTLTSWPVLWLAVVVVAAVAAVFLARNV